MRMSNELAQKHLRSFTVKMLPQTNKRPRRIKIFDNRHCKSVTIVWEYGGLTYEATAKKYLESRGIDMDFFTYLTNGDYAILTRDFGTQIDEEE